MARAFDDSTGRSPLTTSHSAGRQAATRRVKRGNFLASVPVVASAEFETFATAALKDLSPSGPIEGALADLVVKASWVLLACESPLAERAACQAARSLRLGIRALVQYRSLRVAAACTPEPSQVVHVGSDDDSVCWMDRLTWDDAVSEDSPIVRGTWITVGQVVSRIIDGWTWSDVLRAHPELCEDDIRSCIAFTVEDEDAR